jgi:hypothetical protein
VLIQGANIAPDVTHWTKVQAIALASEFIYAKLKSLMSSIK